MKIDVNTLSSQIIINNSKALFIVKDLLISNRLTRRAPVPREKKLSKEIKARAVEVLKKLLTLIIN